MVQGCVCVMRRTLCGTALSGSKESLTIVGSTCKTTPPVQDRILKNVRLCLEFMLTGIEYYLALPRLHPSNPKGGKIKISMVTFAPLTLLLPPVNLSSLQPP